MIGGFLKRHPYPVRSVWRRVHAPTNALFFSTLHVNEFPKSGGTWLCRMLSECLGWRFDDNTYPWFGPSVVKHHRRAFAKRPTVTVIRDPRDVAVSYYYHCRHPFEGDEFNRHNVRLMEERVFRGQGNKAEELDAFVAMITGAPLTPPFTWGDFYRHPDRANTVWVRYEDLRQDTTGELTRLLGELGMVCDGERIAEVAARHDIARIRAQRSETAGTHFIRKGETGGWRRELSPDAVARIEADAGDLLHELGYS